MATVATPRPTENPNATTSETTRSAPGVLSGVDRPAVIATDSAAGDRAPSTRSCPFRADRPMRSRGSRQRLERGGTLLQRRPIMHVVILCDSKFGNTKHLAEAMQTALRRDHHVELLAPVDGLPDPRDIDVLLVGGPTHAHGASEPLKTALAA